MIKVLLKTFNKNLFHKNIGGLFLNYNHFKSTAMNNESIEFPVWGLVPNHETGVAQFLSKYPNTMNNESIEFPVWGLVPKHETGVAQFLSKYPEYDGRGIRIAIFDSGVDPGANGLKKTSEGKVKIVERFDCSGCGDVDTSTVVKPDEDGYITGLNGRKLKIPTEWKAENDEFHIGVKNGFDLFPKKLVERIEQENKEKKWDPEQKTAIAEINRQLQKFENNVVKKGNGNGGLSEQEILAKEDLEASIEFLTSMDKKYADLGTMYDCIVFYDGIWKACIDTTETGDLKNALLLGEYSKTHEYDVLTKCDQLNISINVHDNGNLLEIVGLCSGHGTHVASICSAYFEDNPEKNGVAPGAEIISLTIGDGRLTSMETGTSLIRAMIKVIELHKENPIHVINMSYGEHAHWSNSGRIGELMNEVINKYGIVWVASAGNHGPALCTIGTPPDISQSSVIGVGAYVSPEMMVAEYSLRNKLPGMAFTWSSRGPTIDGDLGISVCAPGAAITSVPNYTLRNAQLLNGTSMAAPHVSGAIGIMLSGLLKRSVPFSPYSVKRALENSAKYMHNIECFAQGHGLLQVEPSFNYLTNYYSCVARDVRFSVSCGNANTKGILLRTATLNYPFLYSVNIEPFFKDCDEITAETKIAFNMHITLICTDSFVEAPKYLELQNQVRTFSIRIDPTGLSGVHYTSITGYDASCLDKGPLFTVPITIIQPIELKGDALPILEWKDVVFEPNNNNRHFILVPELATWCILKLICKNPGQQARVIIHCMQILSKRSCKSQETYKMTTVTSQAETGIGFQVKGGVILELVVAKYWANIGDLLMDYKLSFYGVKPDNPNVCMQAVDGIYVVDVQTLRSEEIMPAITLKSSVQVLKPNDSKISPLNARDVIPVGRQIYELVLSYDFHLSKGAEVMPNSPLLSEVLYESEFESQLWMLFDTNKQLLAAGDAYPLRYNVKLERGDYIIKLQIRHEKKEYLDKLVDIPMLINRKLPNSVSLDVYNSYNQAVIAGKKLVSVVGQKTTSIPFYISPFCSDKSKASLLQGNYLIGTISYAKDENGKKVDTYPFKFIPYEPPKKSTSKTEKETKTKMEEYLDNLRDMKISFLSKLDVPEQALQLYEELKSSHPNFIPAHLAMLQSIEPMEIKKLLPVFTKDEIEKINQTTCNKVIEIADTIISNTDKEKMLIHFAIKSDPRPESSKIKGVMEKQKMGLLDAYGRIGIALCRLYLLDKNSNETFDGEKKLEDINAIWKDILKFVDPAEQKANTPSILLFFIWHATVMNHYGRTLKYLNKILEDKSSKEVEEKISEVCDLVGWKHCSRYIKSSLLVKYPIAYKPF